MTREESHKLEPGLYKIFWMNANTEYCLASVGVNAYGDRWFSPTNWTTVPAYDWTMVVKVEKVIPTNQNNNTNSLTQLSALFTEWLTKKVREDRN